MFSVLCTKQPFQLEVAACLPVLSIFFLSNPKTLKKIKSEFMHLFSPLRTLKVQGAYLTEGHCPFSFFLLLMTLGFCLVSSNGLKLFVKYGLWWFSIYLCYSFQAICLLILMVIWTDDIWKVLSSEGESNTLNHKRDVRSGSQHWGEEILDRWCCRCFSKIQPLCRVEWARDFPVLCLIGQCLYWREFIVFYLLSEAQVEDFNWGYNFNLRAGL